MDYTREAVGAQGQWREVSGVNRTHLLVAVDRAGQPTDYLPVGDVVRFHMAHKLTVIAHMPEAYQRLGRLVTSGTSMARREFQDRERP